MGRRTKTMCPWVGKLTITKNSKKCGPYHRETPRAQPTAKDGADGKQYPCGYQLPPDVGGLLKAEDVSPINVIKTINVIPTINVIKINHKCNTNHKCNNF